MDGHGGPADDDQWWYSDDYPGEAAAVAAADVRDNFVDMFANSSEDLFKLVWEGGTAGRQPASSSIPSSPAPPDLPGVSLETPPSDDVMAAWLYPIVSGQTDQAGESTKVPAQLVKREPELSTMATVSLGTMVTGSKGKLTTLEDMSGAKNASTRSDSSERRKEAPGGSRRTTRSSHYSGIHNMTEKRRRCKISDRLRTLQQLVPGCDKSNQASTLEQTIQYMKSLQQQVHSMNMRPVASAAASVYPVEQPPRMATVPMPATAGEQVRPGTVTVVPIVPYGAMIPYAHYHALMMPEAASSALPEMMLAPVNSAAPEGQCSISTEQQREAQETRKGIGNCEFVRQN